MDAAAQELNDAVAALEKKADSQKPDDTQNPDGSQNAGDTQDPGTAQTREMMKNLAAVMEISRQEEARRQ